MRREGGGLDGPFTLTAPRARWWKVFLICIGFAAGGVLIAVGEPNAVGWLVAALFGVGAAVAGWQLVVPGKLVVTATTIEVSVLWRSYSRDLASCGTFEVWRDPTSSESLDPYFTANESESVPRRTESRW